MKAVVAGEPVVLCAERALWLPRVQALLVADVHVGKAEAFQRRGVPVPSSVGAADLDRLSALLHRTGARALWVLGDLVHDRDALDSVGLADLRARHRDVGLHLVRGNHDRHAAVLPASWGFEEHEHEAAVGPFLLRHEPVADVGGAFVLAGHLHPMVELRGAGDRLLLPCFQFGERLGLLPAFTTWSSGVRVAVADGDTYAIVGDRVVPL